MEDSPGLERRLVIHLVLDLPINLSGTLVNVKDVPVTTSLGSHHHVACPVPEPFELRWVVFKPQVPQFLLLLTLGIGVEDLKEVLALSNFPVSIGVDDLCQVLHQSEVSPHAVSQTSDLTELRDQSDLIPSFPVLVNEKRLVGVIDVLIVPGLVVLLVAGLTRNNSQQILQEFHSCQR